MLPWAMQVAWPFQLYNLDSNEGNVLGYRFFLTFPLTDSLFHGNHLKVVKVQNPSQSMVQRNFSWPLWFFLKEKHLELRRKMVGIEKVPCLFDLEVEL